MAIRHGEVEGTPFPCPGSRAGFRVILNNEVDNIAKTKIPTIDERVELENLLNHELAARNLPVLSPSELAEIPLEYKQIWVLVTQVSRFGQGPFGRIASAIFDGMESAVKRRDSSSISHFLYIQDGTTEYSPYLNRFYRLLFVEELYMEEAYLWAEIIDRFFQEQGNLRNGGSYEGSIGQAVFAERYFDSDMGKAFKEFKKLEYAALYISGRRQSRNLTRESRNLVMNWVDFQGTVDEYVAHATRHDQLPNPDVEHSYNTVDP